MEGSKDEIEEKISAAMHKRLTDFKDQADSLTLEGVRRVVEKDLGTKPFALDGHKKYVKQWMEKYFYGDAEPDVIKSSEPKLSGSVPLEKGEKQRKTEKPTHPDFEIANKKAEGAYDGKDIDGNDPEANQMDKISEDEIRKAMKKRVFYFKENSECITMSGVRRLLEEDLKLTKNSLDEYKVFIKKQLDEFLSAEAEEPINGAKASKTKKSTPAKTNKRKEASENSEDFSGSEASNGSEDFEEEKTPPRKKVSRDPKAKAKPVKKQKISAKESKPSRSAIKEPAAESEEKGSSDTDNEANASDDNRASSSGEESSKKTRDKTVPIYGKKVEHLKSVIKSCGMSVPPSVYKRAKDAPESKREAFLIKELEGILEKEGLSTNPSEKDIKALKKRKERAKDLEGIDMSNIVSSSRRRTAVSFIPPKPQVPIESEEEGEEGDEEDDSEDENTDSGVSSEDAQVSEEDADDESD